MLGCVVNSTPPWHELPCLRLRSENFSLNFNATPPIVRRPLRPIRWGRPNRSSRHPQDVSRAGNRGIRDIIACASRRSASTRSCRMCRRSATTAKLLCPPNLGPATPSRPGIRLPNSPCWGRSSPSTKVTRAPAPAVAASIAPRFPRRSAPTSSGHAWPRPCLTSPVAITWAGGGLRGRGFSGPELGVDQNLFVN